MTTPAQLAETRVGADWLRRVARRFLGEADRLDPPAPTPGAAVRPKGPEPRQVVPRAQAAALLIRRPGRRGGWTYALHHGAELAGTDKVAFEAQQISAYGIDAATRDAGLDAAIAFVFGPEAVPPRRPISPPHLPATNRAKVPA